MPYAFGTVGDVDRVVHIVQEHADDLAKAQGHDSQVVATQAQRGRAQQHAKDTGQARAQNQHQPNWGMQTRRVGRSQPGKGFGQVGRVEQAVAVGANRKKGDIAQVQQTGIAHHDIEAKCQQYVEQSHIGNTHPGIAKVL